MSELSPNAVVHAGDLSLDCEPVPAEQCVSGQPRTGTGVLTTFGGVEVGVWEVTPGVMTDVEVDEIFIVLCGAATIAFGDGSPALSVGPGDVVRLAAGAETVWTVTKTVRKVYLTR